MYWLDDIATPTFAFEGGSEGNIEPLMVMKRANTNASVQFFQVAGADHFSILRPLTQFIAQKILADNGGEPNIHFSLDEMNRMMKAK